MTLPTQTSNRPELYLFSRWYSVKGSQGGGIGPTRPQSPLSGHWGTPPPPPRVSVSHIASPRLILAPPRLDPRLTSSQQIFSFLGHSETDPRLTRDPRSTRDRPEIDPRLTDRPEIDPRSTRDWTRAIHPTCQQSMPQSPLRGDPPHPECPCPSRVTDGERGGGARCTGEAGEGGGPL